MWSKGKSSMVFNWYSLMVTHHTVHRRSWPGDQDDVILIMCIPGRRDFQRDLSTRFPKVERELLRIAFNLHPCSQSIILAALFGSFHGLNAQIIPPFFNKSMAQTVVQPNAQRHAATRSSGALPDLGFARQDVICLVGIFDGSLLNATDIGRKNRGWTHRTGHVLLRKAHVEP